VAIIYPDKRAGDKVTLTWDGGPSSDGRWIGRLTLAADDEDIVFHIPVLVLMAAEAVTAKYVVQRVGSETGEASLDARYAVRNYTPLQALRVLDQAGNPIGQIDHTSEWFDVELALDFTQSLQAGDEVVLWLRAYRGADEIFMSTLIEATSAEAIIPVTGNEHPVPLRHRFGRNLIVANQGGVILIHAATVRRNGYIQHAQTDTVLPVTSESQTLAPVYTPDLYDDGNTMFLDDENVSMGLHVSVAWQEEMQDTNIVFCLGDDQSESYPSRPDEWVEGIIPRSMLEKHADTNVYLFCLALSADGTAPSVMARSERRLMTIRRTLHTPLHPAPDPSLDAPSIDRLSSAMLDQAQFPGGPLVRIRPYAGMSPGDKVTVSFRTRSALLPWQATIDIGIDDMGRDITCRIPMVNVAFYLNRMPALYYQVDNMAGHRRVSPRLDVLVEEYVPRNLYGLACAMRLQIDGPAVSECLADDHLILTLDGTLMAVRPGDHLVLIVRGRTVSTSTVIPKTIEAGTDVDARMSFTIPERIIRENAGGVISYRAMKIHDSYVEATPFDTLAIRPTYFWRIVDDALRYVSRRSDPSPRPAPARFPAQRPNARHPARS
jgi:hypothetical protein